LICEDEEKFAKGLRRQIETFFLGKKEEIQFCYLQNGAAFEKQLLLQDVSDEEGFDLIFMDICLGDLDGIELIDRYRNKKEKKTPVIFVSSMEDRVLDGYEVNAFAFLYKRNYEEKLEKHLERFWKEYGCLAKMTIKNSEGLKLLDYRDVYSIEADGRKTLVHTLKDAFSDERAVGAFVQELPRERFQEVYKCVYVNVEHISRIDTDTLKLDNAQTVPVSRRKRKAVMDAVMQYVSGM